MKIKYKISILLLALIPFTGTAQQDTLSIWVNGMCGMCQDRIEKATMEVDGVINAEWDTDSRMLTVITSESNFDENQIHMAVTRVGHDTRKYLAPQKVYDQLHSCCKYRDQDDEDSSSGINKIWVDGLCGMCKDRIEKAVLELDGIKTADWDEDTSILTYSTDDTGIDEDEVHKAVASVGHDTRKYKAPRDVYEKLHTCCKYRDNEDRSDVQPSNQKGDIWVDGICGMCKDRIEKAVLELDGIKTANWDEDTKMLTYTADARGIDEEQVHLAVTRAGHDTRKYKAPQDVYEKLHTCCKYRDNEDRSDVQPFNQKGDVWVDGICGMCKDRIEKAVLELDGIKTADWDEDTRMLTYTTDARGIDEEQVHLAVTRVGHDTRKYLAPKKAYDNLHDCCKYRDAEVIASHQPQQDGIQIWVDGVCGMCQERIEKAVLEVGGIAAANWDADTRILSIETDDDSFDENQIHMAVTAVGHDTKKYKSPDEVYNNLHACCLYRDADVVADHRPAQIPGSENEVTGLILIEENGEVIPLPGVNIRWVEEPIGTVTDVEGNFAIERPGGATRLVASYVGYYTDTLDLSDDNNIELILTAGSTLETVEVTYERKSIEVSFINPMMVQQINSKELLKAACCTLAESFETNPTVDVSFTDAVTGTRQIEMLGLAGPYVQITRENLPDVRGLAAIYGLTYIPGPWVEGIQLAKGPGSVRNGYESMTGQINVELKKPEEGEQFYLNLYGNQGGRLEANVNTRIQVSDKVSTGFLLHGNSLQIENDVNADGFLDMPTGNEWTAINRWKFQGDDGWSAQAGFKITSYDKTSGQTDFNEDLQSSAWGAIMNTQRLEGWAKIGRVFPDRPDASIGLQLSAISHDQDATFGNRIYNADQTSLYANLIYRQDLGNPTHQINTGLSLQLDQYKEIIGQAAFNRDETVPGAFFEYTYQPSENFTAVGGLRGDHHNNFGFFITPRLHLRYALSEMSVLRFSAGQGRRTPSILAENIGMLASSREITIENNNLNTPYGLNQEVAWNFGLNWRQTLIIEDRELIITLDGYRTEFQQQVVVDYDHSPQEVKFYNLEGNSYSNNFQAQLDYALMKNLDIRLAYRFSDVKTDFQQGELERPFVSRHRAFINIGYHTENGWAFDATVNWQGARRIPSTASNPEAFRMIDRSPDYVVTNTQISKSWQEKFDVYLGVENLFNFRQENPILGAEDPFGPYFDSSLVWGPIFGRMVYGGIRYRLITNE